MLLGWGLITSKIHLWKVCKKQIFCISIYSLWKHIFESNLLHSIIMDGKNTFLKQLLLALVEGMFLQLRVEYGVDGTGIRFKYKILVLFLPILYKRINFWNNLLDYNKEVFIWDGMSAIYLRAYLCEADLAFTIC